MGYKEQLCFRCGKACGGCSWSDRLEPVKGWTATKTEKSSYKEESYFITKCPEFVYDGTCSRCKHYNPKAILFTTNYEHACPYYKGNNCSDIFCENLHNVYWEGMK